jgi:hypothetical protein
MAAPLFQLGAGTPRITLATFTPSTMVLSIARTNNAPRAKLVAYDKTMRKPAARVKATKTGKR